MSDQRLRELERRAACGDPGAEAQLARELMRTRGGSAQITSERIDKEVLCFLTPTTARTGYRPVIPGSLRFVVPWATVKDDGEGLVVWTDPPAGTDAPAVIAKVHYTDGQLRFYPRGMSVLQSHIRNTFAGLPLVVSYQYDVMAPRFPW